MKEYRRLKVFLCHSKEDKPKVKKLYHRLVDNNFDVWLDEARLMPGQEWDLEIRKAIREADIVIACLSNDSVTKTGYVQREIRFALDIATEQPEGKTFIIPARFDDCSVPESLRHIQWANLFERDGYRKLVASLNRQMDYLNISFDLKDALPRNPKDNVQVPVLGQIGAGLPLPKLETDASLNYGKEKDAVIIAHELFLEKEKWESLFALRVSGDGLADAMIHDGDIVIMKPAITARDGEMVAIWFPRDKEATLKYFFEEKNRYRLQPANPTMKPIFVKKSVPIEIKGRVVMVIRKVKLDLI